MRGLVEKENLSRSFKVVWRQLQDHRKSEEMIVEDKNRVNLTKRTDVRIDYYFKGQHVQEGSNEHSLWVCRRVQYVQFPAEQNTTFLAIYDMVCIVYLFEADSICIVGFLRK